MTNFMSVVNVVSVSNQKFFTMNTMIIVLGLGYGLKYDFRNTFSTMSLFRKKDYGNKKETPKKTPLPTEYKTVYSLCPFCDKVKWSKLLQKCSNCGRSFTPNKPYSINKASEL